MRPTRVGKPTAKPHFFFFFKQPTHSRDQKPRLQQMPRQTLSAASLGFPTRLPLSSRPQRQHPFSQPHPGEPEPGTAGEPCPAPPRAAPLTHPSRPARATAAAAGWLRAGIREGWRAPAPEDADMWLEAPLP